MTAPELYTRGDPEADWQAMAQRIQDAASATGCDFLWLGEGPDMAGIKTTAVTLSGTHVGVTKALALLPRPVREAGVITDHSLGATVRWVK